MATSITQNNNTVKIELDKPIITVTDNNRGTTVNVTEVDITTVSVLTPGPKGDKGNTGTVNDFTGDLTITGNITANNITADSASFSTRISDAETELNKTLVSSSAQIDLSQATGTATNATNADNIALSADSTNTNRYVPFTATTEGKGTLRTDAGLLYNPSTNVLTTTTFSGRLAGQADSATTATNVAFTGITAKPTLVSGSSQISFTGLSNIPSGIYSSSLQTLGDITASGNISASGNIYANEFHVDNPSYAGNLRFFQDSDNSYQLRSNIGLIWDFGNANVITTDQRISGLRGMTVKTLKASDLIRLRDYDDNNIVVVDNSGSLTLGNTSAHEPYVIINTDITASGDISASGDVIASNITADSASFSFRITTNSTTATTAYNSALAAQSLAGSTTNTVNNVLTPKVNSLTAATSSFAVTSSNVLFGNITASGDISSSGTVLMDRLQVYDKAIINGDITASNDLMFDGSHAIRTLGGSDDLDINPQRDLNLGTTSTDNITIGRSDSWPGKIKLHTAAGNSLVVTGSRVGIGTTTPSEQLDVVGGIKTTGKVSSSATAGGFVGWGDELDNLPYDDFNESQTRFGVHSTIRRANYGSVFSQLFYTASLEWSGSSISGSTNTLAANISNPCPAITIGNQNSAPTSVGSLLAAFESKHVFIFSGSNFDGWDFYESYFTDIDNQLTKIDMTPLANASGQISVNQLLYLISEQLDSVADKFNAQQSAGVIRRHRSYEISPAASQVKEVAISGYAPTDTSNRPSVYPRFHTSNFESWVENGYGVPSGETNAPLFIENRTKFRQITTETAQYIPATFSAPVTASAEISSSANVTANYVIAKTPIIQYTSQDATSVAQGRLLQTGHNNATDSFSLEWDVPQFIDTDWFETGSVSPTTANAANTFAVKYDGRYEVTCNIALKGISGARPGLNLGIFTSSAVAETGSYRAPGASAHPYVRMSGNAAGSTAALPSHVLQLSSGSAVSFKFDYKPDWGDIGNTNWSGSLSHFCIKKIG